PIEKPRIGRRNPRESKPFFLVLLGLAWIWLGGVWPEPSSSSLQVWTALEGRSRRIKRMPRCARVFVLVRALCRFFVSFVVNIDHKGHEEITTKDRKKHEGVGRVLIS